MEGYAILGFLGILMECMKATKNGKLTASITTISDLVTQENLLNLSNPNTPNFADSFKKITNVDLLTNIIAIELLYLLPSIAISFYSMYSMTRATAVACRDKKLSSRDYLSRLLKMFLRTLHTQFHLVLFGTGYVGLFLAIFFSLMILTMDHLLIMILLSITLCFFALIFRMYLAVVWDFASMISVIEKSCYGLEALGKAEGIVKGKRLLYGFALRFLYMVITVIVGVGISLTVNENQKQVSMTLSICRSLVMGFSIIVNMVYCMSYTALYFQWKKTQGEEIEFEGSF